MKKFIALSLLCISVSIHAQTDATSIDEWKSYSIPTNEDTLNTYAHSNNDWMVYSSNGMVYVKKEPLANEKKLPFVLPPARFGTKKYPGAKTFIEVSDGYLVSFSGGEYGEKLFWYSKNGQDNYIISKQTIIQFIKRDDRIFAIESSEHGSIVEIKNQFGKWATTESTKLPFMPDAIGMDDNKNFIVVTTDNLLQISPEGNIQTIIKEGFWSILLYPNSLVLKGDEVYVGMRKGVFKYNTRTKKQEWLMKD